MDSKKAWEFSQEKVVEAVKTSPTVEAFETEYPELSEGFKRISEEMYEMFAAKHMDYGCLLYTSPSPRDRQKSRMPSSA